MNTTMQSSPLTIIGRCLAVVPMLLPAGAASAQQIAPPDLRPKDSTTIEIPLGQRQLFLDSHGIAEIATLQRTMHPAAKKGAVIRPDPDQPKGGLQIRCAPLWIPQQKIYRFLVADTAGPTSLFRWFSSSDGLHWTPGRQPDMGIYTLVYDEQDPDPRRRYKAALPPRGFAVSADGNHWQMLPNVAGVPSGDEANFSYDPQSGRFLLTVKIGGPYGRSVGLATSEDFENWTNHGLVFHADDKDQQVGRQAIEARLTDPNFLPPYNKPDPAVFNVDVYNMGIFRYEGLYIGMPSMYHATSPVPNYSNTEGFHLVHLASSRDLKNWTRHGDRKPFIGSSRVGSGAYDLTQILGPSDAVLRGDELWFYYTGLKYRGGMMLKGGKWVPAPGFKPDRDNGAVCLAVLRRDGFISLDATDTAGFVRTKPFTVPGSQLLVNVDAPQGELSVEILNGVGQVVATSERLTGNQLRGPVKWANGDLADLKGQTASLRFTLRNAQFYSYWLK